MPRPQSQYIIPIVLQWGVNGEKSRLPNLPIRPHSDMIHILALQETGVLNDEGRLAGYLGYHSKPKHPDGRSRASLCTSKTIYHAVVNLDMFSTDLAGYTQLSRSC